MTKTRHSIIAVVDNVIRLKRDTLGPRLLSELRESLIRENPAYHQMKRMQQRNQHKYRYAKLPPATVSSIEEDGQTVYIPRGFKGDLIEMAKSHEHGITFYDKTIVFDRLTNMSLNDTFTHTKYQKKGLGKLVMSKEGILSAPCGGGKTVAGIGILCALKQPTLILVHTHDLLHQWQRELASKALLPCTVGQWGGGVKQRENVTVATIQTLARMAPPELRTFLDHFGCVILDEAHHCPADTFMGIMNLCAARYRFGLTATPNRKDGLWFLATDTIGPVLAEITDADLDAEGRSQACEVREVHTSFYTRHTADEWNLMLSEMTTDVDRNIVIVNQVVRTFHSGHFSLVLSDRVAHCQHLAQQLRLNGINAQVLVGAVPKKQREQIIDLARNGLVDVIVATKVADEGLDIPSLSCVHLTTPTANEPKTQQKVGRIRRPKDITSLVVDYIDPRVSACIRMYRERRKMYRRWGFKYEGGKEI